MGSFAAQSMVIDHADAYAGVVLSGTTALDVVAAALGTGDGEAGDLSAFNAGFEHRTGYEWLSRDAAEVDAYVADPMCGFVMPAAAMAEVFGSGAALSDPARLAAIRADLAILLVSGSADPLAGGGELIELVARRYREAGLQDVEVHLYPDARHELFNETNRAEVTAAVIEWLDAHST